MLLLKITPIEPLVLSRVRVATPDIIASHAVHEIPLPSTVLGALGYMLNIKLVQQGLLYGLDGLFNQLVNRLKCKPDKPVIRGTLLLYNNKLYIPIYSEEKTYFIPIEKLDKISIRNNIPYVLESDLEEYIIHETISRVGTKLKTPITKTIEYGYMYKYLVSTYMYIRLEKEKIIQRKIISPSFIYLLDCGAKVDTTEYLRIGGRTRIGKIEVMKLDNKLSNRQYKELISRVKSITELNNGEKSILINPLPIVTSDRDCIRLECYDITRYLEIYGLIKIVKNLSEENKIKLGEHLPTVKIIQLGLGYSEAFKTRRPLIPTIPHGTLIELKHVINDTPQVIRVIMFLGYGTVFTI